MLLLTVNASHVFAIIAVIGKMVIAILATIWTFAGVNSSMCLLFRRKSINI